MVVQVERRDHGLRVARKAPRFHFDNRYDAPLDEGAFRYGATSDLSRIAVNTSFSRLRLALDSRGGEAPWSASCIVRSGLHIVPNDTPGLGDRSEAVAV